MRSFYQFTRISCNIPKVTCQQRDTTLPLFVDTYISLIKNISSIIFATFSSFKENVIQNTLPTFGPLFALPYHAYRDDICLQALWLAPCWNFSDSTLVFRKNLPMCKARERLWLTTIMMLWLDERRQSKTLWLKSYQSVRKNNHST